MQLSQLAIVAVFALAVLAQSTEAKCNMANHSLYPPDPARALPWYTINLDLAPQDRWTAIVQPMAAQINKTIYQVIDLLPAQIRNDIISKVDAGAQQILDAFPAPYGDEIRGIAAATGIDVAALILYNIAYELEGGCTSIVAENDRQLYHARNLDFGLFFGWDKQNETWQLTEDLRPLLFNAKFVKAGVNIYNTTQFAGFVGLLTGMKKGGFSISVDTRYDNSYWNGLYEFFKGNSTSQFLAFLTRSTMENAPDFNTAFNLLNGTSMIGPCYIILGGNQMGQGAVLTRSEGTVSLYPWTLQNDLHKTHFYVLETNYDHWVNPPFFDDRVHPAEDCLAEIGQSNIGFSSLFNMLSAEPNLNLLTTYTTLIDVAGGYMEAYMQRCPTHPCPPW